ncbi:MAG TPA: hypothetical protein VIU12_01595 [Chryseolinea sp.]
MSLAEFPMVLATLIGLICNFRQEKGTREQLSYQQFMDWLETHRHEDIKNLISETHYLQTEITNLLREDIKNLDSKFASIEHMLSLILSKIDGFSQIVQIAHPGIELSSQAIEVLEMFVKSGAVAMLVFENPQGLVFGLVSQAGDEQPDCYSPQERQFFDDDIKTLCHLGFIREDLNSVGTPTYRPTRAGYYYIQTKKLRS